MTSAHDDAPALTSVRTLDDGRESWTPATDDFFEVLANRRRRYALHYLKRSSVEQVEIGALAERIAAWENDVSPGVVSSVQRKRVYTALQQFHLPKMDAAGVISFEKDRGLVVPDPVIEEFDVMIDFVPSADIPWSEYYLALSVVSAALLAAVWLAAFPFGLLSPLGWSVLVVVAFGLSSLVHLYYERSRSIGVGERPPEVDRR